MENKDVVLLIKYAVEHLLDSELTYENGWVESDIEILNNLKNRQFTIEFK